MNEEQSPTFFKTLTESEKDNPSIPLPLSVQEFTDYVDFLCRAFEFTDSRHVTTVLATAISHLPNDTAQISPFYFAQWIKKSMANHVANFMVTTVRHESRVDVLVNLLVTDPNNQQARDQLNAMVNEGFEYAKRVVEKMGLDLTACAVTNILSSNKIQG